MKRKIIGLLIVAALFVAARMVIAKMKSKEAPHPTVKVAVSEKGDVISTVSASGSLQAFTMVDVKSKAGGKVVKMAVEEGTRVKPGQLLCLIDRVDMQATYGQASADVRASVAQVRQSIENLKYQKTTVVPQIQQAAMSLSSSRAKLRGAKTALDLQRETSETQVEEARQMLAAAKARLDQAEQQALSQPTMTQAAIAQAEANLKSAQENLRSLQSAKHPQDETAVQSEVDQSRSEADTMKLSLDRMKELKAKGFASLSQVDTAENQWVTARARLQTARAKLDTLKEQHAAELGDYQARVAQNRAAVENAKANAVQDKLRQKEAEAASATSRQAEAALAGAEANRKQVALKQEEVQAAEAAARQAEATLASARANTLQNGVKEQDVQQALARLSRAEITANNAKTNLEQTTVVAPFAGVVLKKYVDEGTIIQSGLSSFSSGSPIVQLADTSRLYVDAQVDEADIALIDPGQTVSITLDAYPNSPKEGAVRKVFPQAQVDQSVTYIHVQVEVDPVDVDERLRPGMNATCEFLVEEKKDVLTVPSEAVKDDGSATEITVIKDAHKPLWESTNQDKRKVEVGLRGDERSEVLSGLKEGETVVTQVIEPIVAQQMGGMGGPPRGAMGGGRMGRMR